MLQPAAHPVTPLQQLVRVLRPFTFLATIYAGALVLAGWELAHRGQEVDLLLDPRHNFTNVVAQLYPDDPAVHQLRTDQMLLCARQRMASPVCRQFDSRTIVHEARQHFEQGIRSSKHIEQLYYNYVQFLQATGAPQQEVDAADRAWRNKFPLSRLPDPR